MAFLLLQQLRLGVFHNILIEDYRLRTNFWHAQSTPSSTNRGLGFHMDEAVGGPVVTVRSSETGEVVRQIPNEVVVRVAHSIEKMKGLMFNSKT